MFDRIGDILDMYQFGNGSILFCLRDMRHKAEALSDQPLVDRIDQAIPKAEIARKKNYDWQMHKRNSPAARNAAVNRDVQIDRTLGQIHTMVDTFTQMEGDTEYKRKATVMKDDLFPNGVHPITTQTFEQEHASVTELLSRLRNEYATTVDLLNLNPLVDNLEQFNDRFGQEINVVNDESVTFDQVQAARTDAEDAFHKVIMQTFAHYMDDGQTRVQLLAAVRDQNQRIAQYRKRRGSAPQVDPGTGEVVEDVIETDIDEPIDSPTDTEPTNTDTPATDTEDVDEPVVEL